MRVTPCFSLLAPRSRFALTRRSRAATSAADSASRSLPACRPFAPPRSTRPLRTCRCDKSFFLCSGLRAIIARCQTIQARHLRQIEDVADALAFALRFQGRERAHNADELMSAIVGKSLVEHLERSGFVIMKGPAPWRRRCSRARIRGLTRGKILACVAVDFSTLKAPGAAV